MDDILIGDVWVMNGQSNMAWALSKTGEFDMEAAQADLPLLRRIGIKANESDNLETDLPSDVIEPWTISTPQTAGNFGAIGFSFASRVQRALGIPIGIIDNARGGASIESLVPRHKFADDPLAAAYLASVEQRRVAFDWDAEVARLAENWEKDVAQKREQGTAEDRLPPRHGKPIQSAFAQSMVTSWAWANAFRPSLGVIKCGDASFLTARIGVVLLITPYRVAGVNQSPAQNIPPSISASGTARMPSARSNSRLPEYTTSNSLSFRSFPGWRGLAEAARARDEKA